MLAGGATVPRDLPVPGRELAGIHQAMEYLPLANRAVAAAQAAGRGPGELTELTGMTEPAISARGKDVVIIGGGDTGADCLGTAHRQGAASVTQLEILPRPPASRPDRQPWPTHPMIYRVSSAHEEGGERVYAVSTEEFRGDESGRVRALRLVEVEFTAGPVRAAAGHRAGTAVPAGAARPRLHRGRARAAARRPGRGRRTRGGTWRGTGRTRPRPLACS